MRIISSIFVLTLLVASTVGAAIIDDFTVGDYNLGREGLPMPDR